MCAWKFERIAAYQELCTGESGARLIQAPAIDRPEAFSGPAIRLAPDLTLRQPEGGSVTVELRGSNVVATVGNLTLIFLSRYRATGYDEDEIKGIVRSADGDPDVLADLESCYAYWQLAGTTGVPAFWDIFSMDDNAFTLWRTLARTKVEHPDNWSGLIFVECEATRIVLRRRADPSMNQWNAIVWAGDAVFGVELQPGTGQDLDLREVEQALGSISVE